MSWFKKAFGWTKWIAPTTWLANNWWVNPRKKRAAADMRGQYQPRSASYGQVLPTVYGTTLVTAPAWCRGYLEVHDEVWRQHQLALGLCQGPVAAVRALWLSDGSDGDTTKSARIEWARAQECGFTLQPGNLDGNLPTAPSFMSSGAVPGSGVHGDVTGYQVRSGGNFDSAALHIQIAAGSDRTFLPMLAGVTRVRLANVHFAYFDQDYQQWLKARIEENDCAVVSVAEKELVVTMPFPASYLSETAATPSYLDESPFEIRAIEGGFVYPGMGHLRANPVDLAALYKPLAETQSLSPTFMAEVTSLCATAPDGLRAQGADVILDMIGPAYYSANLNSGIETDIGAGGAAASGYRTYCNATGFYVSGSLDEQASTADHIQGILDATNATAVDSEGKLKILPLGDEPITANGYTYTPNTTPVYDLAPSSMLGGDDAPMIQVSALDSDLVNVVSVEYLNSEASGANYRRDVETAFDGADIARQAALYGGTGKREGAVAVLHWISTPGHARTIAQLMLQRARAIRNVQSIQVGWRYALLEPVDLVTLTDERLDLDHAPVRIGAVEEDQDGNLSLETMDWPLGLASATQYQTTSSDAGRPPISDAPGAASEPWVGVVPAYLTGTQESAIWIAAAGASESYGGCDVYLSTDDVAYAYQGSIAGRSCMGYLRSALPAGAALDTTNTLAVDVGESRGVLTGTSSAGRDALETLCVVGSELLAFQTAAAGSGSYEYNLTSLRRGAYETAIGSHAAHDRFVRIDQRVLRVAVPPTYFGITLYLKLVPFNLRGAGRPALADVSPWTAVLTASTALAPSACTLTVTDAPPAVVANQWRATADENLHRRWANVAWTPGSELAASFEVVLYTGTDPDAASAYVVQPVVVGATITSAVLACSAGASALTVRAAVRARFANGRVSAWRQSATSGTIDAGTGAVDGTDAKVLTLQATAQVFRSAADGSNPSPSSITLTAVPGGALAGTATWTVEPAGAATLTGTSANVRTLTFANLAQPYATITASINDGAATYSDRVTIVKVVDGSSAVTAFLTNESHTVPASPDGTAPVLTGAVAEIKIFVGSTDDSAAWTVTKVDSAGVTSTLATRTVTVTAMTVDSGWVDITATKGALSVTKRFSLSKSRAGAQGTPGTPGDPGVDALTCFLTNDAVALAADVAGALTGSAPYATTTMKVMRGITDESALWSFSASPASSSSSVTYTLTGTPTNTLNVTGMATTIDSHTITLTATRSGYPTLTRQFTIAKSKTGATGSTGSPGAASTSYWLACSPSAVQKTAAGAYVQTSITAQSYSATGTGSPAAYAGRFVIATSDGTTWTDRYTSAANESSRAYTLPAGVVAIRVRLYLAGGTTTLLDEQVIPVVADGATGDAGAPGLNALTPVISNAAHTVPAASDGTVSSYAGSGTTIQVYEGSTALTFNGATVAAAGQFAIGTPTVSPAASITVGARSGTGTTTATVAQHSAMTQDVVTVTYPITARRANGTDVALSLVQTVTKSKTGAAGTNGTNGTNGERGSMTFYVDISPYTTWADSGRSGNDAASAVAAWGGASTGDTLTQYNTSAGIAITRYYNGSAWVSPGAVVDGNLLVTDTVAANKCKADVFQTAGYAYGGTLGTDTEYATSGAKMRRNDTTGAPALLVSKEGLKIGQSTLAEGGILGGMLGAAIGRLYVNGPAGSYTWSGSSRVTGVTRVYNSTLGAYVLSLAFASGVIPWGSDILAAGAYSVQASNTTGAFRHLARVRGLSTSVELSIVEPYLTGSDLASLAISGRTVDPSTVVGEWIVMVLQP